MTRYRITLMLFALAAALPIGRSQAASAAAPSHPRQHYRRSPAVRPTIEQQIDTLRQQMQSQIDGLRQQLSDRDVQLQQVQQSALQAQQSAQAARQAANQEQQAIASNDQTVSSLQSSVADLRVSSNAIAGNIAVVQQQETHIQNEVDNPDEIHYKGVTISPHGSFLELGT